MTQRDSTNPRQSSAQPLLDVKVLPSDRESVCVYTINQPQVFTLPLPRQRAELPLRTVQFYVSALYTDISTEITRDFRFYLNPQVSVSKS